MIRVLTILATIVALAVSAAPASAATSKKPPPRGTSGYTHMEEISLAASRPLRNINNIDLWVGVKDGSSNTVQFAERSATSSLQNTMVSGYNAKARSVRSFTIDIGTSEAARSATSTLENTLVSGRKAKPKSKPNKGHGGVHAMWDITSGTKA